MAIKNTPLLKLILSCPDALLESLTIEKLILYIRLASHLRREILHVQKPTQSEEEAPISDLLPTNVKQFLAQSMAWTQSVVEECWDIFRNIIWTNGMDLELHPIRPPDPHDLIYFEKYGHPLLLGMFMLCDLRL
jgi:hypothetical protein